MKIQRALYSLLGLLAICLFAAAQTSTVRRRGPAEKQSAYVQDGENGDSPADLSAKGWKAVLKLTQRALKDKELARSAAALAYYATLTFFPALIGFATCYAIFASPEQLLRSLDSLTVVAPEAVAELLQTQLQPIADAQPTGLGIAAALSIAALLWATSGGLQNLIKATNVAYDVRETRGLIKMRLLSLAMSFVLLVFAALVVSLLLLQPGALHAWGAPSSAASVFSYLRWPALIALISLVLAFIYRYAPNRHQPRWQWVSWGALAATLIWLAGTVLFFFYVQHFGNFNKTYGTFAGIIIMMTWFNLSALIVLLGAQVNKKLEDVTAAASKT
ncbi:MAG TPA: YihY/virulence factor BrkB family protein [Candidatus Saccharimonadales bacterium]|nr:YihY/virulence factor BrkB family protein [Candidatus Saccharimonadales bacterium]